MKNNCDHCGDPNADWCINPYRQDIDNIEIHEWICSSCFDSLCGDI